MPNLTINGQSYFADAPPDTPLLWVIREDLRLTGTKYGCGVGLCGSCTVHIDGQAVRSCSVTVGAVEGCTDHDHRGPEPGQRPSGAAGLDRASGAAMRLLPVRPDHAGRGVAFEEPEPHRAADRRWHERQSVPLRHLLAHRRCREARRRDHEGAAENE